jgi:hypothetical protein
MRLIRKHGDKKFISVPFPPKESVTTNPSSASVNYLYDDRQRTVFVRTCRKGSLFKVVWKYKTYVE